MGWDFCESWTSYEDVRIALLDEFQGRVCAWGWGRGGVTDGERSLWLAVDTAGTSYECGVIAVCVLVAQATHDVRHPWFGYKEMSEDMGPYIWDIPEHVWKVLTAPGPGGYADGWRQGVAKMTGWALP